MFQLLTFLFLVNAVAYFENEAWQTDAFLQIENYPEIYNRSLSNYKTPFDVESKLRDKPSHPVLTRRPESEDFSSLVVNKTILTWKYMDKYFAKVYSSMVVLLALFVFSVVVIGIPVFATLHSQKRLYRLVRERLRYDSPMRRMRDFRPSEQV